VTAVHEHDLGRLRESFGSVAIGSILRLKVRILDAERSERRLDHDVRDALFHHPVEMPERMRHPPERNRTKRAGTERELRSHEKSRCAGRRVESTEMAEASFSELSPDALGVPRFPELLQQDDVRVQPPERAR
jgi:hypothetical protein